MNGSYANVLLNRGANGFERIEYSSEIATPLLLQALDLNADRNGLELRFFYNNAYIDIEFDAVNKAFSASSNAFTTTGLYGINQADLNGDGYSDQLKADGSNIYWSENLQNGTFTPALNIATGGATNQKPMYGIHLIGSALNDIVFVNGANLNLIENTGSGNFEGAQVIHTFNSAIVDYDHGDLDNDGDIDLVVALTDAVYTVINNGDGTFSVSGSNIANATGISDITLADMNNDSALDVVLSSISDSKLAIISNTLYNMVTATQTISHAEALKAVTLPALAVGLFGTDHYHLTGTDAGDFTISSTGQLSFVAAPNVSAPIDADTDNIYELTITASNGSNGASLALEISVAPLDSDEDGLTNEQEIALGTDPNVADTDGDGVNDGDEVTAGTDPMVNDVVDTDNDGLTDVQEAALGTDPNVADSDGDGVNDGDEVAAGTDPSVNQADTDGDGLFDLDEINVHGTNPNLIDSDLDGVNDGDEIAVGTDPTVANTDYIISFEDGLLPSSAETSANSTGIWGSDGTTASSGGNYSLRAQAITHSQEVGISFTANFNGDDLSFWAKVSSEQNYDGILVLIDDVLQSLRSDDVNWVQLTSDSSGDITQNNLSGELPWTQYYLAVPAGIHTVTLLYYKDNTDIDPIGDDTAWIDDIRFTVSQTPIDTTDTDNDGLTDAQEASLGTNPNSIDSDDDGVNDFDEVRQGTHPLTAEANIIVGFEDGLMPSSSVTLNPDSKDNLGWEISSFESSVGSYSMRAKSVSGQGQFNSVSFIAYFSGAVDLTFDYKTSSTTNMDGLALYIDNVSVWQMGGDTGWQSYQYNVPAGLHVVSFVYGQNGNNPSGENTAWIDNIQFQQAQFGPDDDMDQDGLSNSEEITAGTVKVIADSDQDGLNDGDEVHIYSSNPTVSDSDSDGLDDGVEISTYNSDPTDPDTDNDGVSDGDEVNNYQTDPTLADTDSDGVPDGDEINAGTNPRINETDGNTGGEGDGGGGAADKLTEGGGGGGGSLAYFSLMLLLLSVSRRKSFIRK